MYILSKPKNPNIIHNDLLSVENLVPKNKRHMKIVYIMKYTHL